MDMALTPIIIISALSLVMFSMLLMVDGQLKTDSATPRPPKPPKIQLRAILVRCPYRSRFNTYKDSGENVDVAMSKSKEILQFYGYDRDEPLLHSEVVKCRRKLVVTIKLSNCGKLKKQSDYVVIDHIYDPISKQKARLLHPIVLKITQRSVLQSYPLYLEHIVNGEATEEIISKETSPDYTGCDATSNTPTCGRAYYGGKSVPFSEGFCCSCDLYENVKRQPVVFRSDAPETDLAFSMTSGLFPQQLSTHRNASSVKTQRNADRELLRLSKEFELMDEKTKAKGFLNFLEDQNTSFVDVDRLKRYYPKFPIEYYMYPPMEPAKGFRRSDFKNPEGVDPWEAAPPVSYYWKEYYEYMRTSVKPILHILSKRSDTKKVSKLKNKSPSDYKFIETKNSKKTPTAKISWNNNNEKKTVEIAQQHSQKNKKSTRHITNKEKSNLAKRQITASGTQKRGGQDCIDRTTPPEVDPFTYHESAHCLRFSDLWYTVYKIKSPFVAHTVGFEIYEKHCLEGVRNKWEVLTKGFKAEIGTFERRAMNKGTTVVLSYTPYSSLDPSHFCLPPGKLLLLVPRPLPDSKLEEFPQPTEPSGKYLLVHPSDITYDGDDCDRIGVSYSAFFKQPDRCNHAKGTCLNHQPLQMWRYDTAKKARNEKGKYFLENYASVPDQAIMDVDGRQFLTLDYEGHYESIIEIEFKADNNGIIRKESTVQISEIYVDATCDFHAKITICVTNNGLVSSLYRPRMTNCPVSIPTVWYQQEGPLVAIAPQRKHFFRLSLYGRIPGSRFHCSIEILNRYRKIMAVRRVRIQKYDRCICMWHCLCACSGGIRGLECQPMSKEHFHAAGFLGSMPMVTNEQVSDDVNYKIYLTIGQLLPTAVCIHVFLLLFGLIKAILGLCCSKTIAILHLHLVCPSLVRHLENKDPIIATTLRIAEIAEGFHTHWRLKIIEFFFNLISFLVVPGWCFLYFLRNILRGCLMCIVRSDKKRTSKKKKKKTTIIINNKE